MSKAIRRSTASPAYAALFLAQLAAQQKNGAAQKPAVKAVLARLRTADQILGLSKEPVPETTQPLDKATLRAQLSGLGLSMPPLLANLKQRSKQENSHQEQTYQPKI